MALSLRRPTATLLLALLAAAPRLGGGVRLEAEVLTDPEEGEGEAEDASCSMRTVTDGTLCGATSVVTQITNALCGVKYCTKFGQQLPCGFNSCPQTSTTNNTCEVIDRCPLKVRIFLEGQAYLGEFANATFDVQYKDLQIMAGVPEVRDFLNANTHVLESVANILVQEAVKIGQQQVDTLKTTVTHSLASYASGEDIAKYFNTLGDDPHQALNETVRESLPRLGASFVPYSAESLEQHALAGPGGTKHPKWYCDRWLRVNVRGEQTYYIENWQYVEVARTFDLRSECESTFYAQCARGSLQEVRRCPGDAAPKEKERCLPGPGCFRFRRVIHGWITSIRLPGQEDEELIGGGTAFLSVAKPKTNKEKQRFLEENEEAIQARELYQENSMQAAVSVPLFQSIFQEKMCRAAKKMKARRCKVATSTLFRWFQLSIKVPMPESELLPEDMPMKLRFHKGSFQATASPSWSMLEGYIEQVLMDQINAVEIPMDVQITAANVELKPEGEVLKLAEGTWVDIWGEVDAAMLAGSLGDLGDLSQMLGGLR